MADRVLPGASGLTGLASGRENLTHPSLSFWELVREDLSTHVGDLLSKGFWSAFWYRFGNRRNSVKPSLLPVPRSLIYRLMFKACESPCEFSLPSPTILGHRACLEQFGGMTLVPISIGSDVTVRQNATVGTPSNRALWARPVIDGYVDIGAGAVIVGDITIGHGAIIGANAEVTKSVAPYGVVVGVPRRVNWYRASAEIGALQGAPDAGGMP